LVKNFIITIDLVKGINGLLLAIIRDVWGEDLSYKTRHLASERKPDADVMYET